MDAYALPVPIRKYFVKKYNKRMEELKAERDGAQDTSKPLSDAQKRQFIQKAQQHQSDPSRAKGFFKPAGKT